MESREIQSQATAGRGLIQTQQQQQQQQPPPMTIGSTSSSYSSNTNLINSNPTANIPPQTHRFAFNHLTSPPPQPPTSHNQHQLQQYHHQPQQQQNHQQNHQNQQQLKPLDSLNNSVGFDGSPSQFQYGTEPTNLKKKRGRPRKYAPDGNIALQLAPATPLNTHSNANHGAGGGGNESIGLGSGGGSSEAPAKRSRGRPPGSGKRQIDALGGVSGVGFTPHVITVNPGEDISSKIMAFPQQGPRTVCILSANGAVSNVTLRQPVASTVKYEGQYEIISLSGSLSVSENNGSCSRSGGLNVSLAGSDGRVVGGGVVGTLQAASPVQIVVGSFISDGRKQNLDVFTTGPAYIPTLNTQNFGAQGTAGSSPSQGGSSESSEENGGSPLNGGSGFYTNSAPPSIQNNNMQMNSQMNSLWPGHNQQ